MSNRPIYKAQLPPASTKPITGQEIRDARKSRGWSQARLAGTLGVSQQLISHLEFGRRELTPEIEVSLRKVLKL
ncbi:helix-turn-helix transcriptional regulator [Leptolyngbya sp. FACHB-261]|nr:helix-turn-helix transcriptional regulator [Leptolyngbya sp. FACHB-261]